MEKYISYIKNIHYINDLDILILFIIYYLPKKIRLDENY